MTLDPTPGPRDQLVTRAVEVALRELGDGAATLEALANAEASERLSREVAAAVHRALAALRESSTPVDATDADDHAAVAIQTEAANALIDDDAAHIALPPRVLREIRAPAPTGGWQPPARLPVLPLGRSDLLVNASGQPNIGSELQAELETAQDVDLICAFVIMSGVTRLEEQLRALVSRGGRLRVITTTYMGATKREAVDRLVEIGAQVRVALDAQTTKLHAKAWLLERPAGMTTAFIGSSNLSHTALFDGLEWNVRLAQADAGHVIDTVRRTFDAHWASEHFVDYDPRVRPNDRELLDRALRVHDKSMPSSSGGFVSFDIRPRDLQQRMLDRLDAERRRHGRHRNLIVAATGTGKTVLAALDYRRLQASLGNGRPPSLLFVAHNENILRQALGTYRAVLDDPNFGELHGAGQRATGQHVFAMVQTLTRQTANTSVEQGDAPSENDTANASDTTAAPDSPLAAIDPHQFDVVVVDEFHHAAAPSYRRLLDHLKPKELLGLTATPERTDGIAVQDEFFGGRIAAELRLWEAIDAGSLVPFQYFGVADDIDLSQVTWRSGDYDRTELEGLYTADDARVHRILRELRRVLGSLDEMRALGFCVSVRHAHYMAEAFTKRGVLPRH